MLPSCVRMRRVSWVRIYRNFDLKERCRLFRHSLSTTAAYRKEDLNETAILKLKKGISKSQNQDYENTFGNIDSFETKFIKIKEDPEDVANYKRDKAAPGKKIPQYIKEVKEHLRNRDYKSALRVLEVDMYNDRKPPVPCIYSDLIMYNARLGNLEEAYRLYTNFKKFGGKTGGAMYTALFAACQNCRNRDLALKGATAIREFLMNDKYQKPNDTHYRAMIKAFANQGDLTTCFKLFDEFMHKRDKVSAREFQTMFNAFLNDQNAGLRYSLLLWRKMLQYRIQPTIGIFDELLVCVRFCSLGQLELLPLLIKEINELSRVFVRTKVKIETVNDEKRRTILKMPADGKAWFSNLKSPEFKKECEILKKKIDDVGLKSTENTNVEYENTPVTILPVGSEEKSKITLENDSEKNLKESEELSVPISDEKSQNVLVETKFTPKQCELPNLIAFEPTLGSVVDFKAFTTCQHRFLLLGGARGFLKVMLDFGVIPTAKTLTQMLFLVPEKKESYEEILHLAKALNIKLDTGFFNAFIKVRIFLGEDFDSVQKYLLVMQEQKLQPDLLTFGTLALACVNLKFASQLVKAVDSFGFRLNSQIVGALLNKAVFAGDFEYVKGVLDIVKTYEIQVDGKFVAKLVNFVEKHKHLKKTNDKEHKLYTYSTS